MIEDLQVYFSNFGSILKSYHACKVLSYKAAPTALIPRFIKHPPKLIDNGSHLLVKSGDSAPLVIPVTLESPKEYLKVLIGTCEEYGGVYDVSKPYADALGKYGFVVRKRPWGYVDFVYDTQHLIDMPGGKLKKYRNELRKVDSMGVTVRELTDVDHEAIAELEEVWAFMKSQKNTVNISRSGLFEFLAKHYTEYPTEARVKMLGVFHEGVLVASSLSAMLSGNTWGCGFRQGNRDYPSIMTYIFNKMAKLYSDLPFECDGDAGGEKDKTYHYKQRLLSQNVLTKQQYKYVVSKK